MKFTWYADPGHAWLKVPFFMLKTLAIENKISRYSYMRKNHVFLEEDCDAEVFISALKASGKTYEYTEKCANRQSKIRSYRNYAIN